VKAAESVFVDQGSPGVEIIFSDFQVMTLPGMIGRLLEDLFDSFPLDLEIAVKACLAETQDHHVIRSPNGGFPALQHQPV
jgi:hypothetical protein